MKDRIFKTNYIIVALVLALLGIALLWISESFFDGVLKSIFSQVALAILISVITGVINEYILKDSLVDMILEKIKIKDEVNKTGLEEIVPDITKINYNYYFRNAKKNIDIVHIYGRTWTTNHIDEITERVKRSNCKVRVILVDPESLFAPALESHFKYSDGKLKELINDVSKVWKSKYDKIEKDRSRSRKSTQGSIQLYYHKGQPTNSIYRVDDRVIIVQTKTTQEKTTRMPAMIFKDTTKEDCFYNIYVKEIEELIKESKLVDFNQL